MNVPSLSAEVFCDYRAISVEVYVALVELSCRMPPLQCGGLCPKCLLPTNDRLLWLHLDMPNTLVALLVSYSQE